MSLKANLQGAFRERLGSGVYRRWRWQASLTPRTQLSVQVSLVNWTFGLYVMRYGPHDHLTIGLDLGPLEAHLMVQKRRTK